MTATALHPGAITEVAGLPVGHHRLAARPTGCTVVLCPQGATTGGEVRGALGAEAVTCAVSNAMRAAGLLNEPKLPASRGLHTCADVRRTTRHRRQRLQPARDHAGLRRGRQTAFAGSLT
jgi:L-aminopeptidase/D-esterase-like protein